MNPCNLTASITALANALASRLTTDEMTLLAAIFVQLGDTLATVAVGRSLCEAKEDKSKC